MTNTIIIFIPVSLYQKGPGQLIGVIQDCQITNVKNFYILDLVTNNSEQLFDDDKHVIGYYCRNEGERLSTSSTDFQSRNWLLLGLKLDDFVLHKVSINGEVMRFVKTCQVISILYDDQMFMESELLLQTYECNKLMYRDHFKTLTKSLKSRLEIEKREHSNSFIQKGIERLVYLIQYVVQVFLHVIVLIHPVLKYSSLGLQVETFLESVSWALNQSTMNRKLTLKVGNFLVATIVDVCSGMLLLYWLMALITTPAEQLLNTAEVVVDTLRQLLHWLMGIPAGLKLNFAFNNMLGRFFLYHINLWWTFLVVAKPLLGFTFQFFLWFGRLGITFQAAILADLLALASFHIYCIYVYAARLYNLQVSGLIALWRLFLGRKRNPLRVRVDSCKYSPDQLFIGTLAFTILLFLLPTTFMYYIVFTTLRLLLVGLGGLLTRIRILLQTLPLYVTYLWLLRSKRISKSLHLTIRAKQRPGPLVLSACPVPGSWWSTIQCCIPEPVKQPPKVEWGILLRNLVTGHLIYPV